MNRPFISKFLALTLLLVAACGTPHAKKQPSKQVDQPTFQIRSEGFFLGKGDYNKTLSGSILLWNEKVTTDAMAEVVEASSQQIDAAVDILQFDRDKILSMRPQFEQIIAKNLELNALQGAEFLKLAEPAAAEWFSGTDGTGGVLGQMSTDLAAQGTGHQPLSSAELGHAGNYFTAYCEAKLWQRAVHAAVINDRYTRRPTPLALCEGIYKESSLLSEDSDACSASSTGKSYFDCLWREGVLKTKLFATRYGDHSDHPETGQILTSLSSADLINLFSNQTNGDAFVYEDPMASLQVQTANGTVNIPLAWTYVPGRAENEAASEISNASIREIIFSMEVTEPKPDGLRILPVSTRTDAGDLKIIQDSIKAIRTKATAFGVLASHRYVNEVTFNVPFLVQPNPAIDVSKHFLADAAQKFPGVFTVTSPELERIKADIQAGQIQLVGIGQKFATNFAQTQTSEDCKKDNNLGCHYAAAATRSIAALKPASVTTAWLQTTITVRKSAGGGLLNMTVDLDNLNQNKVIEGCAVIDNSTHETCGIIAGNEKAKMSINKDNGQIELRYRLTNPGAVGLGEVPRSNADKGGVAFNTLHSEDIEGLELVLNVNLNMIKGVLTTLMGSAMLVPPSQTTPVISHGSVKLTDEAPDVAVQMQSFGNELQALQAAQQQ